MYTDGWASSAFECTEIFQNQYTENSWNREQEKLDPPAFQAGDPEYFNILTSCWNSNAVFFTAKPTPHGEIIKGIFQLWAPSQR
jgi:hypothetical protein